MITGQPSVLYYAGPILQSAGFSAASDATRLSVVIGLFKLLMTWIAILKVDDLGRRPLLIGGVGGIVVSLLLLSAYYKFLGGYPLIAVASLLLYVGCYQLALTKFEIRTSDAKSNNIVDIIRAHQLAYGVGNFPTSHEGKRNQSSSSHQFWFKCHCNICILAVKGVAGSGEPIPPLRSHCALITSVCHFICPRNERFEFGRN
ncbi:hypothetical protein TIFTF001_000395 [Ficus carica]|uniref:Uncharacterized protein n=1 Tax=Ficus carica TaxID=3494 RepID=A0AA87Z2P3_FICCA|nr:hypothetical protein TIFTF001_000395 [Ficus carica]